MPTSAAQLAAAQRYKERHPDRVVLTILRWFAHHQHEWSPAIRKKRCRELTVKAINTGILARPACCQQCGKACKPAAHHVDFTDPLAVRFYCRTCHDIIVRELEQQRGIRRAPPARRSNAFYEKAYKQALELLEQGYTQREISRRLGIDNGTISKWQAGLRKPRASV